MKYFAESLKVGKIRSTIKILIIFTLILVFYSNFTFYSFKLIGLKRTNKRY